MSDRGTEAIVVLSSFFCSTVLSESGEDGTDASPEDWVLFSHEEEGPDTMVLLFFLLRHLAASRQISPMNFAILACGVLALYLKSVALLSITWSLNTRIISSVKIDNERNI